MLNVESIINRVRDLERRIRNFETWEPPEVEGGSGGIGDMTKAVYDTDDDGVVDNSERLEGDTEAAVRNHTPQAHKTTHQDGGPDEINVNDLSGQLADNQPPLAHDLGGSKHNADELADLNAKISDATLDDEGDPRDPNAHKASHQDGGSDEINVDGLSGDLADEQDPKSHASSHKDGGSDELDAAELAGALGSSGQFLKTDGDAASWDTPPANDEDAIHDNETGEIAAVTEKANPVDADLVLIEDSEDGNNKKRVQAGNLPGGGDVGTHELTFSQVVDVEVVNTTDESTLLGAGRGTKTISADELDVGTTIRLRMFGYMSGSGTPTMDIDVSLGGTTVCTTGAVAIPGTVTDADFHITVEIVCRSTGATGTVVASGLFEHDEDVTVGMVNTSEVTLDTTSSLALDVTVTWGTADADNTITCQEATIELLQADTLAVAAPSELTATEV